MDSFGSNKLGGTTSGTKSYSMPPFKHTPKPPEKDINGVANEIATEINNWHEPEEQLYLLTEIRNRLKEKIKYRMDENEIKIHDMRNELEMMIEKNETLEKLIQQI